MLTSLRKNDEMIDHFGIQQKMTLCFISYEYNQTAPVAISSPPTPLRYSHVYCHAAL
jgi:hypothetical protein